MQIRALFSYIYDNLNRIYKYYIEGHRTSFLDVSFANSPEKLTELYFKNIAAGDKRLSSENDSQIKEAIEYYELALSSIKRLRKEFNKYRLLSTDPLYLTLEFREAEIYTALGQCHEQLGQYQKAIEHYDHSIRCNKFHREAYVGRATILTAQKHYEESNLTLQKLLNLYEDKEFLEKFKPFLRKDELLMEKISVYIDRAINFIALKEYNEAEVENERAKRLTPVRQLIQLRNGFLVTLSPRLAAVKAIPDNLNIASQQPSLVFFSLNIPANVSSLNATAVVSRALF